MDQIIARRLDRKGLIHTRSFPRAELVLKYSRFRELMILNTRGDLRSALEVFRDSKAPRILVTPSATTGVDFPYRQCLYQIIGKVPFADSRDPLTAARIEDDPEYQDHITAAEMVQQTGRPMRAVDDYCETFILDDQAAWFVWKAKQHFPQWWLDAYSQKDVIPKPIGLDEIFDQR